MTNYEVYIALMRIRVMFDDFFTYEVNKKEIIMAFKIFKSECPDFVWVELKEFYKAFKKIEGYEAVIVGNIENALDNTINKIYKNKSWT